MPGRLLSSSRSQRKQPQQAVAVPVPSGAPHTGRHRPSMPNEAAQSSYVGAPPKPATAEREPEGVCGRLAALSDSDRDVVADAGRAALALGALGVVYGDIGTSPLYTEQVIFTSHRAAAHATPAGVFGVVSLIFWALMIVVSIKYA